MGERRKLGSGPKTRHGKRLKYSRHKKEEPDNILKTKTPEDETISEESPDTPPTVTADWEGTKMDEIDSPISPSIVLDIFGGKEEQEIHGNKAFSRDEQHVQRCAIVHFFVRVLHEPPRNEWYGENGAITNACEFLGLDIKKTTNYCKGVLSSGKENKAWIAI